MQQHFIIKFQNKDVPNLKKYLFDKKLARSLSN